MPENKEEIVWTEFTGAGSAYRVFEQHKKNELNASGERPVFVIPDPVVTKKNRIN